MTELHLQTMRDAEALCERCRAVSAKPLLRAGIYCADAASVLGALSLLYGDERPIMLDTDALPEEEARALLQSLSAQGLCAKGS